MRAGTTGARRAPPARRPQPAEVLAGHAATAAAVRRADAGNVRAALISCAGSPTRLAAPVSDAECCAVFASCGGHCEHPVPDCSPIRSCSASATRSNRPSRVESAAKGDTTSPLLFLFTALLPVGAGLCPYTGLRVRLSRPGARVRYAMQQHAGRKQPQIKDRARRVSNYSSPGGEKRNPDAGSGFPDLFSRCSPRKARRVSSPSYGDSEAESCAMNVNCVSTRLLPES